MQMVPGGYGDPSVFRRRSVVLIQGQASAGCNQWLHNGPTTE